MRSVTLPLYEDSETKIFEYAVGRTREDGKLKIKKVFGDPLAIWNRLTVTLEGAVEDAQRALRVVRDPSPDPSFDEQGKIVRRQGYVVLKDKDGSEKEYINETPGHRVLRIQAEERFVSAIRVAFKMLPLDPDTGQGATDQMCWDAYDAYGDWTEGEEKRAAETRSSSTASAGPLASPSPTATT